MGVKGSMAWSEEGLGAGFLERVRREEEARFCFVIWDLVLFPGETRIRGVLEPDRRLAIAFQGVVVLAGPDPWPFFAAMPPPRGEVNLCFDPPLQGEVEARFRGLRLVDPTGRGRVNRFLCLECERDRFRPSRHEAAHEVERLTPALVAESVDAEPKLRELARSAIPTFVHREGDRIVSRAPAPHITREGRFSFAVIRGVETLPVARGRGYASACVSALCRHLWDEVGVRWIYLWVEERNAPARRIYRNMGFRAAGAWRACVGRPR